MPANPNNELSSLESIPETPLLRRSCMGDDELRGSANASWERPTGPSKLSMKDIGATLMGDALLTRKSSKENFVPNSIAKDKRERIVSLDADIDQLLLQLRSTTFIGTFEPLEHAHRSPTYTPSNLSKATKHANLSNSW